MHTIIDCKYDRIIYKRKYVNVNTEYDIYLWKDLWGFGNRSPAGAQLPPPISGASAKSKNAERPNVGAKNIIGLLPWDRLFGGSYSGLKMFIQEFEAKPLHVCDHLSSLILLISKKSKKCNSWSLSCRGWKALEALTPSRYPAACGSTCSDTSEPS